jgi:hypothetical protein
MGSIRPSKTPLPSQRNGFDWIGIGNSASVMLVQSCDQLVNSDGSLTADGVHVMHCIRNGDS